MGPFFPVKEFLSQIIYEINHIIDLRMISDELILAGKLQLIKISTKKSRYGLTKSIILCLMMWSTLWSTLFL